MGSLQPKSAQRFGQVPVAVLRDPQLSHADRTVYAVLASYRNQYSGTAWPCRATIAGVAGLHPDSISRSTRRLVACGHLEKRSLGGAGNLVLYRFPALDPPSKPPATGGYSDKADRNEADTPICIEQTKTTQATPVRNPSSPKPPGEAPRGDLIFSPSLPKTLIPALLAAVKDIPGHARQRLLDELEGAMGAKVVHNPVGYLRALARLWRAGELVPEHADRIATNRRRREEVQRAVARASRIAVPPKPERRPVANPAERISALRQALHGPPCGL
jgi:hypothetical protein